MDLLTTVAVILLVLWLLGYFGPARFPAIPQSGGVIHILLVLALIALVFRLLSGRKAP